MYAGAPQSSRYFSGPQRLWDPLNIVVNRRRRLFSPLRSEELSEEDADRMIDVNLKGTFKRHQLRVALPLQRAGYGKIINFSSVAAVLGGARA